MNVVNKNNFRTNFDYYKSILKNENIVLRHGSALECLEMFVGYLNDSTVDVYSLEPVSNPNVNVTLLDSFNLLETIKVDGLVCTTFRQTINDMLSDPMSDLQALLEALSGYYYAHNNSFEGLDINPENQDRFETIKNWGVDYYTGG